MLNTFNHCLFSVNYHFFDVFPPKQNINVSINLTVKVSFRQNQFAIVVLHLKSFVGDVLLVTLTVVANT